MDIGDKVHRRGELRLYEILAKTTDGRPIIQRIDGYPEQHIVEEEKLFPMERPPL